MAADVVSMTGRPAINPHKPVQELVEFADWLSEAIKSGEIQGIAGAVVYADTASSEFTVGHSTKALAGALALTQRRVLDSLYE